MTSRDIEKEFDPTQWSTRITDSKELLANHVEFGKRGKSLTRMFFSDSFNHAQFSSILFFQFLMGIVTQSTAC